MTKELIFTKRAVSSGKGYLVWIPKNIVDFLKLSKNSYVQVNMKDIKRGINLQFIKKIAKSGRGHLVWIPKDVSDFLKINEKSICEFKIAKLGDRK